MSKAIKEKAITEILKYREELQARKIDLMEEIDFIDRFLQSTDWAVPIESKIEEAKKVKPV